MNTTLRHAALAAAVALVASKGQTAALRSSIAFSADGVEVNAEAGVLKNVAVMTVGPALGHGFVCDATTIQQVADLINKAGSVKVRWKHPAPVKNADGDLVMPDDLGTDVGYLKNARIVGDACRADVYLADYAAKLPVYGDVRSYLLAKAKDDPTGFGMSAVIGFDTEVITDKSGQPEALAARVYCLEAVDFVGTPAANPNGLLAAAPNPLCTIEMVVNGRSVVLSAPTPAELEKVVQLHRQQTNPATGASPAASTPETKIPLAARAALFPKGNAMDPKMKQYLQANHGLAADATDETAQAMFDGLPDEQKAACRAAMSTVATLDPTKTAQLRTQVITDDGERLLALEGKRVTQIRQLGELLKAESHVVQLAIASNDTVLDAKKRILDDLAAKAKPVAGAVTVGPDKKIAALTAALPDAIRLRSGQRKFVQLDSRGRAARDAEGNVKPREPHELAERYASLTVLDMYRQWLIGYGAPTDEVMMLSRTQLCDILGPRGLRRKFPHVAQLAQSSSDFDNILLDAQNKTMMMGYVEAPRTWNVWAKRATAPDFKNINRINISEVPTPTSRKEGGPIKYTVITDSKETYVLIEYTSGVILTRITLLNDDMNALQDIPMRQGQSCARLEDDVAYSALTANANMADGGALFNSTAYTVGGTGHQNLVTVTASVGAPTVATVSGTEKLIMLQKGPAAAAILNLTPKFWIGPVALKTTAEQFFASRVDPSKYNDTPNPYNGKITPISNARMDAVSTTAWNLMADYRDGQVDTIEVCFLQDEPEPVLKQETDFDTDDQKYAVRHVVAAKPLDFRGMAQNPGA